MGILKCDYPRTKMFFPNVLLARLTILEFDECPNEYLDEKNLIDFSQYLVTFWNEVNQYLIYRYPIK